MMRTEAVLAQFSDVQVTELTGWVERGWVQPDGGEPAAWDFREIDIARVRLIHDLRRDLDVAEDAVPLVLSLLDQVYELRCTIKGMVRAVSTQPPTVQQAVLTALRSSPPPG
jgi:chaperone modulatory protein CbpM